MARATTKKKIKLPYQLTEEQVLQYKSLMAETKKKAKDLSEKFEALRAQESTIGKEFWDGLSKIVGASFGTSDAAIYDKHADLGVIIIEEIERFGCAVPLALHKPSKKKSSKKPVRKGKLKIASAR